MQLLQFGTQLNEPIVLCLGYFGTMHLGHVELVRAARQRAMGQNAKVALFTFSNNHLAVLGKEVKSVYTFEERLMLYENVGVDYVLATEFDDAFRATSGEQFANSLLKYNLVGVVCGFDYSCGCDRMDSDGLRKALGDVQLEVVDAICDNGEKVSTTLVRKLLSENRVEVVNRLLSQPFCLTGEVVHGRNVGMSMGFPTANLKVSSDKYLPIGVFCGSVTVDGKCYRAIINIGQMPTFDLNYISVEVHIVGFDGILYGKKLTVTLTQYLRPIQKFDTQDALVEQLHKDKQRVQND